MHALELQAKLTALLEESFSSVSKTAGGAIVVALPDNPVRCQVGELSGGALVVDVTSPIFLDVPAPEADVYQLICVLQHQIPFGSLAVVSGAGGGIHMLIRAQLLAEGMTAGQLVSAVRLVQGEALAEIHRFRQLAPPLGGETAYGR